MEETVSSAGQFRDYAAARRTPWVDIQSWLQEDSEGAELRVRALQDRPTDRQTDRQTHRQREREGEREERERPI
jgi:hypothetical protein